MTLVGTRDVLQREEGLQGMSHKHIPKEKKREKKKRAAWRPCVCVRCKGIQVTNCGLSCARWMTKLLVTTSVTISGGRFSLRLRLDVSLRWSYIHVYSEYPWWIAIITLSTRLASGTKKWLRWQGQNQDSRWTRRWSGSQSRRLFSLSPGWLTFHGSPCFSTTEKFQCLSHTHRWMLSL